MNINLNKYVVINNNGTINVQATLNKFSEDLQMYDHKYEAQMESIGNAVNDIFDQYIGARLNTAFIQGEVVRRMNIAPQNYNNICDKVQEYLHIHSQGKTDENGNVERPNSYYLINKGKGGGVARRHDIKSK